MFHNIHPSLPFSFPALIPHVAKQVFSSRKLPLPTLVVFLGFLTSVNTTLMTSNGDTAPRNGVCAVEPSARRIITLLRESKSLAMNNIIGRRTFVTLPASEYYYSQDGWHFLQFPEGPYLPGGRWSTSRICALH